MRSHILSFACVVLIASAGRAQTDSIVIPESQTLVLRDLEVEAMMRSPEIDHAGTESEMQVAMTEELGRLPAPEFRYMEENMEGFNPSTSMFRRFELMQMVPFPTKLFADRRIGEIRAEHADHDRLEKIGGVLSRLRMAYIRLWYAQQMQVLEGRQAGYLATASAAALARLRAGTATQGEVLTADVERAAAENRRIAMRQEELSSKAMLMGILGRNPSDTLGYAVISEEIAPLLPLDTLLSYARRYRPMLLHDSLGIDQSREEASRARQEWLPDLTLGVQRVTSPMSGYQGWSAILGISLPFAPWSMGGTRAMVDIADAKVREMDAAYRSSRAMVESAVREQYARASAAQAQLRTFQAEVLPKIEQMVAANLNDYRSGRIGFSALLSAYRMQIDMIKEFFMIRMTLEDAVIALEHETGMELQ